MFYKHRVSTDTSVSSGQIDAYVFCLRSFA